MVFVPAVSSSATEGKLFLLARGQALCVSPEGRVPVGPAADALHLGVLDGVPCFARPLRDGEAPPEGTSPLPLRQLFSVLAEEEFGVAARALGLLSWDRDHRFCGRCGAATKRSETERTRTCTVCGLNAYPRLSPAVITLIEREGRALLARNARFPVPFFSTLAGFVEVGETLEDCLRREVREEAGIEIDEIRYFGSQPWPFTNSLMVGFTARYAGGELRLEPTELAEADWFAPDALPQVPPKLSIARALIDDFVRRHRKA